MFSKFKARCSVKVYFQQYGVDYIEPHSPVLGWCTVRAMLRLSTKEVWKTRQVDFTNAFSLAHLSEIIL